MKGRTVRVPLTDLGFPHGATTKQLMDTDHAVGVSRTVKPVMLSVADLGFEYDATTKEIIGTDQDTDPDGNLAPYTSGRGHQLGLQLCSPEVAPYLRLEYKDQPLGERLYAAMKPIATSDGEPRIFVLGHDANGLSLDAVRARAEDKWHPSDKFMFCLEP